MRAALLLALLLAAVPACADEGAPVGGADRYADGRGYAAEALDRLLSRDAGEEPASEASPEAATDC